MESILEGKQHLKAHYKKGVDCPCCGQFVKAYRRKIDSGVALFLVKLGRLTKEGEYLHAEKVLKALGKSTKSMNYSIARYWELIEKEPIDKSNTKKKSSGNWRLTDKGWAFIENRVKPFKYVITYNSKKIDYEFDKVVSIVECLGDHYNYAELMSGY